ncbi:hypothetical protein PtB15_8B823, partial [Puccinia triticina]
GWRISVDFIKTSSSRPHPDPTGFHHAIAYWLYGDQDLYTTLLNTIICQTKEQTDICNGKPQKLHLFYSLLEGQYNDPLPHLLDLLYHSTYGAFPSEIAFVSAACLLKAVIVLVQTDRSNPSAARCTEYSPIGIKPQKDPFPSVYLFYDYKLNQFQILWNPKFHQYPEKPVINLAKRFKSSAKSPIPAPSSSPPLLTITPLPKTPAPSNITPASPISLNSINRTTWSYLENQLKRSFTEGQSEALLPSSIKDSSYFETGNFEHIGWRLTINFITQGQDSMWRALSVWAYKSQDSFINLQSRFQKFDYDTGLIPKDTSPIGIQNTLRAVSSYFQVSIYLINILKHSTSWPKKTKPAQPTCNACRHKNVNCGLEKAIPLDRPQDWFNGYCRAKWSNGLTENIPPGWDGRLGPQSVVNIAGIQGVGQMPSRSTDSPCDPKVPKSSQTMLGQPTQPNPESSQAFCLLKPTLQGDPASSQSQSAIVAPIEPSLVQTDPALIHPALFMHDLAHEEDPDSSDHLASAGKGDSTLPARINNVSTTETHLIKSMLTHESTTYGSRDELLLGKSSPDKSARSSLGDAKGNLIPHPGRAPYTQVTPTGSIKRKRMAVFAEAEVGALSLNLASIV